MEVVPPLGCTPQYENTKHNLECNEWRLRFVEGEITRITRTAECSTVEQQQGEKLDVLKKQNGAIQNRSNAEIEIEQ